MSDLEEIVIDGKVYCILPLQGNIGMAEDISLYQMPSGKLVLIAERKDIKPGY